MRRLAAGATLGLVLLLPGSAPAAVGGITEISDRQEAASCGYARANAPASKRPVYADRCRSAALAERQANAVTAAVAGSFTYENPVYGSSLPDPGVARDGSTDYYAYGTGSRFPIIKSSDLVHWEQVGRAFSARPSWVVQTGDWHPWAPSVLRSPESCPGTDSPGCYFMYYVGLSGQHTPATHCVGVAWSLTPAGPFTDLGPLQAEDGSTDLTGRPPGCGDADGYGHIDPAPFVDDDGSVYLYVSTSRSCAQPTTASCPYEPVISVLPLTDERTQAAAARKPLFGATPGTWEQEPAHAAQVENPWVEKRGSTYFLFYSGGFYGASYGMGYATASSPTGDAAYPAFAKSSLNPILGETAQVLSPGGGSVTSGPDASSWLVYHGRAGDYSQPRTLRIDPLFWSDTSVFTPGPTTGPQVFPPEDTEPPPPGPEPPGGTPTGPAGGGLSGGTPAATPSSPPAELAPAADLTPPTVRLVRRLARRAGRAIRMVIRATSEDAWVTLSGRVRIRGSGRRYALRGAKVAFIERGHSEAVALRASAMAVRAIRRALRRHRRVTIRVTLVARDAAGNTMSRRLTVALRGRRVTRR